MDVEEDSARSGRFEGEGGRLGQKEEREGREEEEEEEERRELTRKRLASFLLQRASDP